MSTKTRRRYTGEFKAEAVRLIRDSARQYATRSEATQDIFEYIEVFYNRQRRHSTLGDRSPAEIEARAAIA